MMMHTLKIPKCNDTYVSIQNVEIYFSCHVILVANNYALNVCIYNLVSCQLSHIQVIVHDEKQMCT